MEENTLVEMIETILAKKLTFNLDTKLKFTLGGNEIGTIDVQGKVEYVPSENENETDS
jgi:hypothetical protein